MDSAREAFHYESDVNKWGAQYANFMGLCLYPVEETFSNLLGGVLRTHPSFIYKGSVKPNAFLQV
jgi:hypothetical protein